MDPMTYVGTLLFFILIWISFTKGEIRCYCNAPSCVQTGYMCKSEEGRCYSMLTYDGDGTNSAHGCIDLLKVHERVLCNGRGDVIKARNDQDSWPILMCCKEDMCNYMDNGVVVDVEIKTDNSSTKGQTEEEKEPTVNLINHDTPIHHDGYSSERELWFKAAVIAVPIAGGFILILLVLLAVRMLRQDSKRHHRLMQMRNSRSLAKAQLYVTDHFYIDKNEKQTKHLKGHFNSAAEKHDSYLKHSPESPVATFAKLPDKKAKDGTNGCSYTRDSVLIWGGTKPETVISGQTSLV